VLLRLRHLAGTAYRNQYSPRAPLSKFKGPWTVVQVPDFQTFMFDWSGRVSRTVSQTVSQNHAYLIRRNGIYYFSRRVPSDLQTRFNKERVTISLRTRSFNKAEKSAKALSDRLERYWDSLRMEMIYSKELGLTVLPETITVAVFGRLTPVLWLG